MGTRETALDTLIPEARCVLIFLWPHLGAGGLRGLDPGPESSLPAAGLGTTGQEGGAGSTHLAAHSICPSSPHHSFSALGWTGVGVPH
jgi:hypothetical protein